MSSSRSTTPEPAAGPLITPATPELERSGPAGFVRRHRWFLGALAAGLVVRVLVMAAFRPAFIFGDAHSYLEIAQQLQPHTSRTVGYSAFLALIETVTQDAWVMVGVQHLLGLLTAVAGYALLRRWSVSPGLATLAMVPVLMDSMQLVLEHSLLSDVLYDLVLVVGVTALAWRRVPTISTAALGGLLLGLSVLVRISGEPVLLGAVGFCLLGAATWRRRALTSLVVVVAFAAPLLGYATWYHASGGPFALTQAGGRSLYMRTTGFVDCSRLHLPTYEQRLCPAQPLGERLDPTYYGWHHPDHTAGLHPPAGTSIYQVFSDFGRRAITTQPGDYVRIVLRDSALYLYPRRTDHYEYDTSHKWSFSAWSRLGPSDFSKPLYAEHGGAYRTQPALEAVLAGYGSVIYLWGPLMGLLVAIGLVGLFRRGQGPRTTPATFLVLSLGVGLILLPVVSVEFVWRYVLPAVVLVPMAAALAWTGLRGSPDVDTEPGTERDDRAG